MWVYGADPRSFGLRSVVGAAERGGDAYRPTGMVLRGARPEAKCLRAPGIRRARSRAASLGSQAVCAAKAGRSGTIGKPAGLPRPRPKLRFGSYPLVRAKLKARFPILRRACPQAAITGKSPAGSGPDGAACGRPVRVAVRLGPALLPGAGLRRRSAADERFEGGSLAFEGRALAFEGRHERLRDLPIFGRLRCVFGCLCRAGCVGAVHGPDTDPDTYSDNGRGGRANDRT